MNNLLRFLQVKQFRVLVYKCLHCVTTLIYGLPLAIFILKIESTSTHGDTRNWKVLHSDRMCSTTLATWVIWNNLAFIFVNHPLNHIALNHFNRIYQICTCHPWTRVEASLRYGYDDETVWLCSARQPWALLLVKARAHSIDGLIAHYLIGGASMVLWPDRVSFYLSRHHLNWNETWHLRLWLHCWQRKRYKEFSGHERWGGIAWQPKHQSVFEPSKSCRFAWFHVKPAKIYLSFFLEVRLN